MSNFWWDLEGKLFILWPALVVLVLGIEALWPRLRQPWTIKRDLRKLYWTVYDWFYPVEEKVFIIPKREEKKTGPALPQVKGRARKKIKIKGE